MQSTQLKESRRDRAATEQPSLSTEAIFDVLSNRRRRYVLHYLKRGDGPVPVRDISEQLAAWENDIDRSHVRPKQRKRLYTALHQTHLPKMDMLGVVEYDRNRGLVSLTASIKQFDIYFDLVGKDDIPWSQFYLALGSVFTSLIIVAMVRIPPFSSLSGFVYALCVTVLFTVVASYHTLHDRQRLVGSTGMPPEAVREPLSGGRASDERDD